LEVDNLIERTIFAEIPPRVEYKLSDYGETVLPIISVMKDWGEIDMNLS
jgi:DNA-binding HxlR family transcriptional regulator